MSQEGSSEAAARVISVAYLDAGAIMIVHRLAYSSHKQERFFRISRVYRSIGSRCYWQVQVAGFVVSARSVVLLLSGTVRQCSRGSPTCSRPQASSGHGLDGESHGEETFAVPGALTLPSEYHQRCNGFRPLQVPRWWRGIE